MLSRILRAIRDPRRYAPVVRERFVRQLKVLEQSLAPIFARTPYVLQSRMDIDPMSRWHRPDFASITGGFLIAGDPTPRHIVDLEPWDSVRRDMLILFLRTLVTGRVPGDFAEVGVFRGVTGRLIHHYTPERVLHLFDTFEGFPRESVEAELKMTGLRASVNEFSDTGVERVLRTIAPQNDNVRIYKGMFPDTVTPEVALRQFAFVHLDADLYAPIRAGLEFFYPRLSPGGFLVVHDYNSWPGARMATDEFFAARPEKPIPLPDKSGSALIVRQGPEAVA